MTETMRVPDPARWTVEKKWGASASQLHAELVEALGRVQNPLAADQLRRVIQDLICGRFHRDTLPKERRKLLLESLRSVPHCSVIYRWQRDLVRRVRAGQYEAA